MDLEGHEGKNLKANEVPMPSIHPPNRFWPCFPDWINCALFKGTKHNSAYVSVNCKTGHPSTEDIKKVSRVMYFHLKFMMRTYKEINDKEFPLELFKNVSDGGRNETLRSGNQSIDIIIIKQIEIITAEEEKKNMEIQNAIRKAQEEIIDPLTSACVSWKGQASHKDNLKDAEKLENEVYKQSF